MDGFRYNVELFNKAESIVDSLEQTYSIHIENTTNDINGSIPSDFEYASQLKSIISDLSSTKMELRDFQEKIVNTRQMLAQIDSMFSYESTNVPLSEDEKSKWYQDIGKAYSDSGAEIVGGVKTFFSGGGYGNLLNALVDTGATIFAMNGSILSGLFKVGEYAVDSITFVAGSAIAGAAWISDQFTGDDKASEIMDMTLDQIGRNLVGEANEKFYQNTAVGSFINDRSNFKYDSAGAQAISKATEVTTKVVGAVAVTIASGGAAAPLVIGAILGVGSGTEGYAQGVDRESGEEYNYLKAEGKALASGVAGAAEFYGYGMIGSGILTAGKTLATAIANGSGVNAGKLTGSFINYFKNIKGMDLKTFTSSFARIFLCKDTAIFSLATITDHGVNWAFGDETTEELIKCGGTELLFVLGLNGIGSTISAVSNSIEAFNVRLSYKQYYDLINNPSAMGAATQEYSRLYQLAKNAIAKIDSSGKIIGLYEKGKNMGQKFAGFFGYEEHNFLHVYRVAENSEMFANFINNNLKFFKGCESINPKIVKVTGIVHDLGMKDGGYIIFDDGTVQKIKYVVEHIDDFKNLKFNGGKTINLNSIDIEADLIRAMHPFNSSIEVLQNRGIFGEDSDMIATLAFLHSKSTSGVKVLQYGDDYLRQINEMFNKINNNSETLGVSIDLSRLVKMGNDGKAILDASGRYILDESVAGQLKTGSIALRVGDAHALKTGFNHGGSMIRVKTAKPLAEDSYRKTVELDELCSAEAQQSSISLIDANGDEFELLNSNPAHAFSKRIILGERSMYVEPDYRIVDGRLTYTYVVKDNNSPASTWLHGIQEKFGEYRGFQDIPQQVIIKMPKGTSSHLKEYYGELADRFSGPSDWLKIRVEVS